MCHTGVLTMQGAQVLELTVLTGMLEFSQSVQHFIKFMKNSGFVSLLFQAGLRLKIVQSLPS